MKHFLKIIISLFLIISACSDNATEPLNTLKIEDIVGRYSSMELTKAENGVVTDLYEIGVRLEIILNSDYTMGGTFFVPDTLGLLEEDMEGDILVNLNGTFSFAEDTLKIESNIDLFIRDANWFFDGNKMYTEDFIHAVLVKK